jgi:hypothetical protein
MASPAPSGHPFSDGGTPSSSGKVTTKVVDVEASVGRFPATPCMLETMQSKEMNQLMQSSATVAAIAVGMTIIGVLITRFHSVTAKSTGRAAPTYLIAFDVVVSSAVVLLTVAITVHFGRRIFRMISANRTSYQLTTLVLLVSLLPTLLPTRAISELAAAADFGPSVPILTVDSFLQSLATSLVMLYVWITTRLARAEHDQREERGARAKTTASGNVAVTIVVLVYLLARAICTSLFRIAFAPLPLQSFITFLNVVSSRPASGVSAGQVIPVCFLTVYEAVLLVLIYRSRILTNRFHASADLVEYRAENIVHRFFKMSTGLLVMPLVMIAMIQFGYPTGQVVPFRDATGVLVLSPSVGNAAISVVLFFFASRQAYVNLPSDTDGVVDWMRERTNVAGPGPDCPKTVDDSMGSVVSVGASARQRKSLTYRSVDTRDPDRGLPVIDPICFTLESAVLLFNFSWLVYTYGTVGFSSAQPADFGRPEYKVTKHIKDSQQDVHALVVDGRDRIIVAFKGSNSVANALTDKDAKLITALNAFKGTESPAAKALPGIHLHGDASAWRGCKVHRGYAMAYAHIRVALLTEISKLYNVKARPIFVCGQ